MLISLSRLYKILDKEERRSLLGLFVLLVFAAVFDILGVASIIPLLSVILDSNGDGLGFLDGFNQFLPRPSSEVDKNFLVLASVIFVISFSAAFRLLANYRVVSFAHFCNFKISERILAGYLDRSYEWHLGQNSATLGERILYQVDRVVGEGFVPALRFGSNLLSVSFVYVLLLIIEPGLSIVLLLCFVGMYGLLGLYFRRKVLDYGVQRASANSRRYGVAIEAIGAFKEVRLRSSEDFFMDSYRMHMQKLTPAASRAQFIAESPRFLVEALLLLGIVTFLFWAIYGSDRALEEVFATISLFAAAGMRILPGAQQMYYSMTTLRFVSPMVNSVYEMTRDFSGHSRVLSPYDKELAFAKSITVSDITYSYPQNLAIAVKGVSLEIRSGERVALVGPSGSGKSTFVDILLGLLEPSSGIIEVDGVPLSSRNIASWQSSVGYVSQDPFFLDDTIAANIAFGRRPEDFDLEELFRVARLAGLDSFLDLSSENGLYRQVGERGSRLSGGQRQRVAIARALYGNPSVLVLDEVTSALDNNSERLFVETLSNLSPETTIVVIAHRLSTIRDFDRLFLFEAGQVIATGSYDDLMAKSPSFRSLVGTD